MTRVYERVPLIYRILARVAVMEDGCWLFTGKTNHGYGRASSGKVEYAVHRVAYEHFVGAIPKGMTIDHICHDPDVCTLGPECPHRRCVNPDHLSVATLGDNVRRSSGLTAVLSRENRCINGHTFTPENTYTANGQRQCRTCSRARLRRWREEHREHYLAQRSAYRAARRAAGVPRRSA